ncbi:MAG: CPBP family intramembrane metalloprotease [Blautia sp.]|nr:CPBP family intramembrane metalloprotease [Blautia sp.]MDY4515016.1 type II CAAX endopeptidase family protein [Lachnospiraceae bacterium]
MNKGTEKKRLLIFILIAYGVTFLLGFLMWYGCGKQTDLSVFPTAQMLYPAAGVMLGYLLIRKEDDGMPKWFFRFFLLLTAVLVILAVLSAALPDQFVILSGTAVSLWLLLSQYIVIVGSLVGWIFLLAARKRRRAAYGLSWKNGKASVLCVLLFVVLYFLRTAVSCAVSGQFSVFLMIFEEPMTWVGLIVLPVNFFLSYLCFFGEEYGWRYYLQPLLQKKFGLRAGVILLGVVWGLWHLPIDFFYYTTETGPAMAAAQQITCISLGIFFAYAYMKTQNIWVPVILHFLNNNLIAVISGNYSSNVLQNQYVAWSDLLPALLINGVFFGLFLFAKPFRRSLRS